MGTTFLEWFDRNKVGIIGSLMLHTTLLFYFAMQDLRSVPEEFERSELRMEVAPPITEEEFERIEQQLVAPQEVKALTSNVTAQVAVPQLSARAQERMAESIEKELSAMEQAEFERLKAERAARGDEINMPELDPSKWDPNRYQEKTEPKPTKVEGVAMVSYDLNDETRVAIDLHRPGFQCRGGGVVLVRVSVDASGRVTKAEVDTGASTTSDDCLVEKAMDSARSARFSRSATAPDPQKGWIKYIFLSQ